MLKLAQRCPFDATWKTHLARVVLKISGQKMYTKFNFLQDNTIHMRLATIAMELQLVSEDYTPGPAAKATFLKIASF